MGADGITLQQEGFGQVYSQCLSPYTQQQLHDKVELMHQGLIREIGKTGIQVMQQSALHRGLMGKEAVHQVPVAVWDGCERMLQADKGVNIFGKD